MAQGLPQFECKLDDIVCIGALCSFLFRGESVIRFVWWCYLYMYEIMLGLGFASSRCYLVPFFFLFLFFSFLDPAPA